MRVTVTIETTDLTRHGPPEVEHAEPNESQRLRDRREQDMARSVVGGRTRRFGWKHSWTPLV